jgi:hypothetical protein
MKIGQPNLSKRRSLKMVVEFGLKESMTARSPAVT